MRSVRWRGPGGRSPELAAHLLERALWPPGPGGGALAGGLGLLLVGLGGGGLVVLGMGARARVEVRVGFESLAGGVCDRVEVCRELVEQSAVLASAQMQDRRLGDWGAVQVRAD